MFLRRKWRVFRFLGLFWGVFGDFGAQNRHFFSFSAVASPLREGVGVLEITPHLLNVSVLRTAHLVRRTVQGIVLFSLLSICSGLALDNNSDHA